MPPPWGPDPFLLFQPLTSEAMSDENIIVKGGGFSSSHFDFIFSLKSGKVIKRLAFSEARGSRKSHLSQAMVPSSWVGLHWSRPPLVKRSLQRQRLSYYIGLHPGKLTWNPKMNVWKIILGLMLILQGVPLILWCFAKSFHVATGIFKS